MLRLWQWFVSLFAVPPAAQCAICRRAAVWRVYDEPRQSSSVCKDCGLKILAERAKNYSGEEPTCVFRADPLDEEIAAGYRSYGLPYISVTVAPAQLRFAVRRLGPDCDPVYCGRLGFDIAAGQLLVEEDRELGAVLRICEYEYESYSLDLDSYCSEELVALRAERYDCDRLVGDGKMKTFRVLTEKGWFPEPTSDRAVQLRLR